MAQSHQNRIHASVTAFQSASEGLIGALERLNDNAATYAPAAGGWNAAQIAHHVAVTNDFLAGILTGTIPKAVPAAAGFRENPDVFAQLPSKVTTFAALEPPAEVKREEAIAKLRHSTVQAVKAIEALTADRASGHV